MYSCVCTGWFKHLCDSCCLFLFADRKYKPLFIIGVYHWTFVLLVEHNMWQSTFSRLPVLLCVGWGDCAFVCTCVCFWPVSLKVGSFCPAPWHPLLGLRWPSPPLTVYLLLFFLFICLPFTCSSNKTFSYHLFSHLNLLFFTSCLPRSSFCWRSPMCISDKLWPPRFHLQPSPNKSKNEQTTELTGSPIKSFSFFFFFQ